MHISIIGWIHTISSVIALWVGARALLSRKGAELHRRQGRQFWYAMIVMNVTALGIYSQGAFRVFHWLALLTLLGLALGMYAAIRQRRTWWAYVHPTAMIVAYYLLIGGAINEAFLRIEPLRKVVSSTLATAHAIALLCFAALLAFTLGQVSGRRGRPVSIGAPGSY